MRALRGVLLLGMAGCVEGLGGETTEADFFNELELETMAAIDEYRESEGLAPLQPYALAGELGREHSDDMLSGAVPFSHDGFDVRAQAMIDDGAVGAAENVAFSQGFDDPVDIAVQGWIESPGHLANIVGDFTHGGVGIARDGDTYYFTHLFANMP